MRFLIFLVGFAFVIAGCVKKNIEKSFENKFEAPLKLAMKNPEYSKTDKKLRCVIEMYKNLDFILKDKLERVGLNVITVAGNIIVVEGTVEALYRASRFDFVHRIGLSHDYQLK